MASDNETHQDYQRALGRPRAKHTPGPWRVEVTPDGDVGVFADDYGLICYPQEDNYQANARLIAKAPELLSTAQYFDYAYNWADDDGTMDDDEIVEIRVTGKALKDLRALLASIEGE